MEAMGALLKGLPLQPEESDRGDLMEAKSQMFLKWVVVGSGERGVGWWMFLVVWLGVGYFSEV